MGYRFNLKRKIMKANEFRIGNKLTNFLGEVFDCNAETIRSFESNYFPYGKPLPIPLTEEWLLKFGFERIEDEIHGEITWDYQRDIDSHECWAEWNEIGQLEGVMVDCVNRLIKYVHQLQNLYFALTNEELEINE